MGSDIKTHMYLSFDGKDALLITNSYKGSPLFGYDVDYIICSKRIMPRYKDCFLHKFKNKNKNKIVILKEV
jgi:hypothetical protein